MAVTPKILYQGQPGTTDTDLYTVPTGKKVHITSIRAVNNDTATKWFKLNVVPNGGTISNADVYVNTTKLVGTGDTNGGGKYSDTDPFPLNTAGDKITGIQETSGAITVTIIGLEE